jgi:hypothetical protein
MAVATGLLHDALIAWDRHPGAEHTTNAYERQAAAVAHELGITTTVLRARIARNRAAGMIPRDAIVSAVTNHTRVATVSL